MIKQFNYIFKPEKDDDTCKTSFEFELKKINDEIFISNLTVEGEKGCIGHNKLIPILIKNQNINEISVVELEKAGCKRAISCAQQLSKALQQIIEKEFD